jgi:hypothetical protein
VKLCCVRTRINPVSKNSIIKVTEFAALERKVGRIPMLAGIIVLHVLTKLLNWSIGLFIVIYLIFNKKVLKNIKWLKIYFFLPKGFRDEPELTVLETMVLS